jgi:hypothetical protein
MSAAKDGAALTAKRGQAALGPFVSTPSMSSNLAVKVRYALGSRKRRTKGPNPNARVSAGTSFPT